MVGISDRARASLVLQDGVLAEDLRVAQGNQISTLSDGMPYQQEDRFVSFEVRCTHHRQAAPADCSKHTACRYGPHMGVPASSFGCMCFRMRPHTPLAAVRSGRKSHAVEVCGFCSENV